MNKDYKSLVKFAGLQILHIASMSFHRLAGKSCVSGVVDKGKIAVIRK
jgi:hypothetical protein